MMIQKQRQLIEYPLIKNKVDNLDYKLSLCGRMATKNFYCKKDLNQVHLLETRHSPFFCGIRYCNCPLCLVHRFKAQLETFEEIKRFDGLRKLWHFVIGFEPVSELEFKKNASKIFKRQQYVLNKYFEKLRKQGVEIQAVRVLDYSFKEEGKVYLHYHFGAIPKSQRSIGLVLSNMQHTRKSMISRMKIQTPFHIQSFGLASKKGVLSYLSIRASGMYKYNMTENVDYLHVQGNLRESIEKNKYIFLSQILTKEEYIKSFYNKAHFVCVGGLPRPSHHGSNITDSIPRFCPIHGELERKDVRIEVLFEEENPDPPPNIKKYPELVVRTVRF